DDLRRYLRHEPIAARPEALSYRAAKFVRRNRAVVGLAALAALATAAGTVGVWLQARTARAQRDYATRQLRRAEAINDLNAFLLSDAAPSGKPFTVGELLARAERVVDRQSGESDENRVELLMAIGRQYQVMEELSKARELLEKAYTLSRNVKEPAVRAKAAAALGDAVSLAGQYQRGESLVTEGLAELGELPQYVLPRVFCLLRGSHVARENGKSGLGLQRVMTAQRLLRESAQGSPLCDLTVGMDVAESYRLAGRHREAADAFAAAFKQLSVLGRDDTDKAATLLNNWALAVEVLGQPLEAERLYRRAIAIDIAEGNE